MRCDKRCLCAFGTFQNRRKAKEAAVAETFPGISRKEEARKKKNKKKRRWRGQLVSADALSWIHPRSLPLIGFRRQHRTFGYVISHSARWNGTKETRSPSTSPISNLFFSSHLPTHTLLSNPALAWSTTTKEKNHFDHAGAKRVVMPSDSVRTSVLSAAVGDSGKNSFSS